jgi:chemotaxis protein MotB
MPPPPDSHDEEQPEESKGAPAWMVTYADMVTLLMTFFVILLSFANMDVTKFREMMGSIRDAFGIKRSEQGFMAPRIVPKPKLILDSDLEAAYEEIGESLEQGLKDHELNELVEVQASAEGVMLRLEGSLIYEPGSATINVEAVDLLQRLSEMMSEVYLDDMLLMVEGHTDSHDISSTVFPSNWELSSARAAGALRQLIDFGIPAEQVVALGFGATRPLDTNDTDEGRRRNRRVEFRMVVTPDEAEVIGRTRPAATTTTTD